MLGAEAESLYARFEREMVALQGDWALSLELSALQAFTLLGQIQVALRHPDNVGPAAKIGRELAECLQAALPKGGAIAEVARLGWDPQADLPEEGHFTCPTCGGSWRGWDDRCPNCGRSVGQR